MQRYKIEIIRTTQGNWHVKAYWEIPNNRGTNHTASKVWDLDGAPKSFKMRREALEFLMNLEGIPE